MDCVYAMNTSIKISYIKTKTDHKTGLDKISLSTSYQRVQKETRFYS